MKSPNKNSYVQIVHGPFEGPFLEVARATCSLVKATDHGSKILTIFLYGTKDIEISKYVGADETLFLNLDRDDLRGSKKQIISKIKYLTDNQSFKLCIAHRSKSTYLALKAFNCPVISIHHAYGDYHQILKRLYLKMFKKRLMMVGVSKSVTAELKSKFSSWDNHRFQTLYNRINIKAHQADLLNRKDARKELGLTDEEWVIGHVARLHPVKDQETLIRAYAKAKKNLPNKCRLVIIGDGREEQRLNETVKELQLEDSVFLAGYRKNAKKLFHAFDCFALTSREETFGMVLLEAMAANVPCIVSNCGGATEVVGDCARIFEVGDIKGLSEALIEQYQKGSVCTEKAVQDRLASMFSDEAAISKFREILLLIEKDVGSLS